MTMTTYPTFSEAWFREINETRARGELSYPRGFTTRERKWVQFAVDDSLSFPVAAEGRRFADVIGVLEGLSLVGQVSIPETFTGRIKKFADFTDHGIFHGAYAARAHGMLGDLVDLFERDRDTRQGVISVFDSSRDLNRQKRDIPCTLSLHFMRRAGIIPGVDIDDLEVQVSMRSNDMWLGTPYDFTQFAILQASLAQALHMLPGRYVHVAGSLHLYERDLAALQNVSGSAEPGGRLPGAMSFPLWSGENTIADISSRARGLLLAPEAYPDKTEFEAWAKGLLTR
jgi:thymidylate synthase